MYTSIRELTMRRSLYSNPLTGDRGEVAQAKRTGDNNPSGPLRPGV